ncbi:MAG: hypothetical protein V7641_1041 [Blastocatellia bacterium]
MAAVRQPLYYLMCISVSVSSLYGTFDHPGVDKTRERRNSAFTKSEKEFFSLWKRRASTARMYVLFAYVKNWRHG